MSASRSYLIQYGRLGHVGRFASEIALARGTRAIVRTPRGVECGEVLVEPQQSNGDDDGEVLRLPSSADLAALETLESLGQEVLHRASARAEASALALSFVDVEVTLDRVAILHALPWDACDATWILDEIGASSGLSVRLLDLARASAAKEPAGCGKPDCGAEHSGCSSCGTGGCSTGSCSRGAMKTAEELTGYFADLRRKMEVAGLVRTPLT